MSEIRHTRGPWEVVYSLLGRPYGINSSLPQDGAGDIKNVVRWAGIGFPTSPEAEANARLIAAAPDLLELALYVADTFQTMDMDLRAVACVNRARAAIAKATQP